MDKIYWSVHSSSRRDVVYIFLASYEFHFIIETGRSSTAPSTCSTRERDKLDPAVKKILSECAR